MNLISDFESERDYWAEQDAIEDLYKYELSKHPHCKDPDHPGCTKCKDNDDRCNNSTNARSR